MKFLVDVCIHKGVNLYTSNADNEGNRKMSDYKVEIKLDAVAPKTEGTLQDFEVTIARIREEEVPHGSGTLTHIMIEFTGYAGYDHAVTADQLERVLNLARHIERESSNV